MTTFRISPHLVTPHRASVEVYDNAGKLVACIYADDDATELRIVSKHLTDIERVPGQPPAAILKFPR